MPTLVGSYSLTVPATAAWTVGPVFRKGEQIRVRSGGSVAWRTATTGGGTGTTLAPIASSPASFSTKRTIAFAIPTGSYASGTWLAWRASQTATTGPTLTRTNATSDDGPGGPALPDVAWPGGATESLAPTSGSWHSGGALTSSELADVNAAAGGVLSLVVQFDSNGQSIQIDGFTLTLTTTAGSTTTTSYGLPEGAYPTDFPSSHALDPSAVLAAAAWTGTALVATGRPPISLAMLVLPDGQAPAFAATSGCLSPQRDTTYDAATGLGASDPTATYRLWFVVNDGLGDFSDDTGGYSVLIDRTSNTTMPEPLVSLISPRFGVQSALGTPAAATRQFGCIADKGFKIKPDQTWEDYGTAGFGYKTGSTLTYDVSSGDATLVLDYLDTGYLLYSIFGGETVTTLATGVYQHVFEFSPFAQAVPPAYSVELPTEPTEIAQATLDLAFNGLKISADPTKRPTASTAFLAGKLAIDATLSAGQNSVQVVSLNGAPAGGSFVLLDGNKPTGAIAYNAAASAVQTALQLLPGYSGATVAGSAGGPWTVTNPTGLEQRPLNASYTTVGGTSTLTGGTSPSVTTSVTNKGGMRRNDALPCTAQSWVVSVASTWTGLENAPVQLTDNWSSEVTVGERYDRKWVQGAAPGAFRYVQKDGAGITDTLALEMAFVAQVRQFINASRAGQRMAARLRSTGAQIASTGFYRSLTIDMDGQAKWGDNSDSDNVRSIKVTFDALYNSASGTMLRVTLVNEIPSYAS